MATYENGGHENSLLKSAPRPGLGEIGHPGRRLRCVPLRRRRRHVYDRRAAPRFSLGVSAKFAKMRRVKPFSTAMSAGEKSRIARR